MKAKILSLALVIIILLLSASCANPAEKSEKFSIVATNFAMYDFARAAAGEVADVKMLLSPGNESHDFEATLADISAISSADLFVYVGGESEEWVYDVFEAIGEAKPETFCAVDEVETFEEEIIEGMAKEEDSGEIEEDEHVWTSIGNAVALTNAIADKIASLDPSSAETVRENAREYTEKLNSVREEMHEVISSSKRKTIVVADRFPFRYLAEETGLDYYAAFSGCSSATEPSLSTVNYLIEKVKSENIPAIFVIEFSDKKTASMVSDETGCAVLTLHSAHNVSREDLDSGVTYADIMERNIDALRIALN
ncbi:MAG: metal ABC transporter substrate-binding protein [bacterium]|nr:metal ABC transporter substrate-binding protein [bacterium]